MNSYPVNIPQRMVVIYSEGNIRPQRNDKTSHLGVTLLNMCLFIFPFSQEKVGPSCEKHSDNRDNFCNYEYKNHKHDFEYTTYHILCFVDRSSLYNLLNKTNFMFFYVFSTVHHSIGLFLQPTLMHNSITRVCHITILDMFRALTCPSSGGTTAQTQHLVSSFS